MINYKERAEQILREWALCSNARPKYNAVDIQIEKDTCGRWATNLIHNLNWGSEATAINAPYMIGVYKRNGVEYTKHDIVEDTFSYFYDQAEDRAQGIRKKKRGTRRRTRKHRSHKRKQSRRHRRRH